jgi:hypothetical protein
VIATIAGRGAAGSCPRVAIPSGQNEVRLSGRLDLLHVFAAGSFVPCCKNGEGYSWLTTRRPSRMRRRRPSGKKARKSLLSP